jgi:hypothetical protein
MGQPKAPMKKTRDDKSQDPAPTTPKKPSSQTRNQVNRLLTARQARDEQKQDLGISLRTLFLCGLPLKSIPSHYYERSCGLFSLSIVGHPKFGGVPFGQDRLIPIWMATAFVALGCPEDNTIEFVYIRDILRTFDLPTDGPHYERLWEGLARFATAQFTLAEGCVNRRGKRGIDLQNFPLLRGCRLWRQDPSSPKEAKDYHQPHRIILDPEWADEIRKHPVPIDLTAVKALRTHPGALDFYQWQAWRSFFAKKCIRIPIFGEGGLLAQLGCLQGQEKYEIKRRIIEWQALIQFAWPTCPNSLSKDERYFVIRPGKAITQSHQNRFVLRGLPGTSK